MSLKYGPLSGLSLALATSGLALLLLLLLLQGRRKKD